MGLRDTTGSVEGDTDGAGREDREDEEAGEDEEEEEDEDKDEDETESLEGETGAATRAADGVGGAETVVCNVGGAGVGTAEGAAEGVLERGVDNSLSALPVLVVLATDERRSSMRHWRG
jgi:hypothetical protein